jgi:aspartyl-tRNA(Asn)/glutamyl-tRNA(Gln) amidotransferase subunit C
MGLVEAGDIAELTTLGCAALIGLDDDTDRFLTSMDEVMADFRELVTEGIPPTTSPTGMVNVFREDEPRESLSQDEALSGAPDTENGYFKLPV